MSEEIQKIHDRLDDYFARQQVIIELQATILAELASHSPDPRAALETIIAGEEGVSIAVVDAVNINTPGHREHLAKKDAARDLIFSLSRKALNRLRKKALALMWHC